MICSRCSLEVRQNCDFCSGYEHLVISPGYDVKKYPIICHTKGEYYEKTLQDEETRKSS